MATLPAYFAALLSLAADAFENEVDNAAPLRADLSAEHIAKEVKVLANSYVAHGQRYLCTAVRILEAVQAVREGKGAGRNTLAHKRTLDAVARLETRKEAERARLEREHRLELQLEQAAGAPKERKAALEGHAPFRTVVAVAKWDGQAADQHHHVTLSCGHVRHTNPTMPPHAVGEQTRCPTCYTELCEGWAPRTELADAYVAPQGVEVTGGLAQVVALAEAPAARLCLHDDNVARPDSDLCQSCHAAECTASRALAKCEFCADAGMHDLCSGCACTEDSCEPYAMNAELTHYRQMDRENPEVEDAPVGIPAHTATRTCGYCGNVSRELVCTRPLCATRSGRKVAAALRHYDRAELMRAAALGGMASIVNAAHEEALRTEQRRSTETLAVRVRRYLRQHPGAVAATLVRVFPGISLRAMELEGAAKYDGRGWHAVCSACAEQHPAHPVACPERLAVE